MVLLKAVMGVIAVVVAAKSCTLHQISSSAGTFCQIIMPKSRSDLVISAILLHSIIIEECRSSQLVAL